MARKKAMSKRLHGEALKEHYVWVKDRIQRVCPSCEVREGLEDFGQTYWIRVDFKGRSLIIICQRVVETILVREYDADLDRIIDESAGKNRIVEVTHAEVDEALEDFIVPYDKEGGHN